MLSLLKQSFQPKPVTGYYCQVRNFWEYVNMMFNKPDPERIQKVGPDRACAEWVLRNGGSVVWSSGIKLADYNSLPADDVAVPKLMAIDGSGSSISHYGFPHLAGCEKLEKIILHKASYIDDRALYGLKYGKNVHHLQVSSIKDVTDDGVRAIVVMKNLQTLVMFDLPSVSDVEDCKQHIKSILPECNIHGTPQPQHGVKESI